MKRISLILCFFIIISTFSGCIPSAPVETLMKPPTLSEEQRAIYAALELYLGENIELCYPKSGGVLSAIIVKDIDDEPTQEAIVFYKHKSKPNPVDGVNNVRVNILDQKNGEWHSVYDHTGDGNAVERVAISSVGADESLRVFVGYETIKKTNVFNVYSFKNGELFTEYSDNYSAFFTNDIDNDKENELLVINMFDKTSTEQSNIKLVEMTENGLEMISVALLSEETTKISNITSGYIEENTPALFIDSTDGELYHTEIIYCAESKLRNPLYLSESKFIEHTVRYQGYLCNDIDGDGIIEIPTLELISGYDESMESPLNFVVWSGFENYSLNIKYRSYYNLEEGYCFIIPNRWNGVVTAKIDEIRGDVVFYKYEVDLESSETELFRIAVDIEENYEYKKSLGYKLIAKNENKNYFIQSNELENELLSLTETEIINNFYIIK